MFVITFSGQYRYRPRADVFYETALSQWAYFVESGTLLFGLVCFGLWFYLLIQEKVGYILWTPPWLVRLAILPLMVVGLLGLNWLVATPVVEVPATRMAQQKTLESMLGARAMSSFKQALRSPPIREVVGQDIELGIAKVPKSKRVNEFGGRPYKGKTHHLVVWHRDDARHLVGFIDVKGSKGALVCDVSVYFRHDGTLRPNKDRWDRGELDCAHDRVRLKVDVFGKVLERKRKSTP